MKNIGFVLTSVAWGGLEINVIKLITWLRDRGWNVILYTVNSSRVYEEAVKNTIPLSVIKNHKKYFDFKSAFLFGKKLKADGIRTLVIFDNKDIDFVFWCKKFMSVPLRVLYQQHMQIGVKKKDFLHTMRFSAIDTWISPLHLLKKEVGEKTNYPDEKVKVIPLGLEIDKFIKPKYSKSEARMKLNVSPSAKLIGIMGRIDPKKGQLFVLEAFYDLSRNNENLRMLIVGSPTINGDKANRYYHEIIRFIDENNLKDKVTLLSHTDDIQLFYNAVDIFALATDGETYGMVTIEAMLSGVPVLATNTGGTLEILDYGKLGYLYTPHNVNEFCTKLTEMVSDSGKLEALSRAAQASAIARFPHVYECEQIELLLG